MDVTELLRVGRERRAARDAEAAAAAEADRVGMAAEFGRMLQDMVDGMGVDLRQYVVLNDRDDPRCAGVMFVMLEVPDLAPLRVTMKRSEVGMPWRVGTYCVPRAINGSYSWSVDQRYVDLADALAAAEVEYGRAMELSREMDARCEDGVEAGETAGVVMRRKLGSCTSTEDVLSVLCEVLIYRVYGE